ncbi:MAG: hypothetical protein WCK00_06750 [Deltaproteobacteria bacterium]
MANLGKKQIILLGIMGIVILFAAVDYLLPKNKNAAIDVNKKKQELSALVSMLSVGTEKEGAKNSVALVISRAEKEWARDPFLDGKSFREWVQPKESAKKEAPVAAKVDFAYTGYLEVKRKRMAIINGIEYKEGEALDVKGYILRSVSPEKVVIENRATRATLTVPLVE